MKHRFLLDENILFFAVKGTDAQGNADSTATELLRRIGTNCHKIVIDPELAGKYGKHLKQLERVSTPAMNPEEFFREFLVNEAKTAIELYAPAELPAGTKFPAKDVHIVKLALRSKAVVVTEDIPLRDSLTIQQALGLTALNSLAALELAKDS